MNAIRLIDQAPEKEGYREEAADWITGENGKKEYVYQYVPEDTPPENVIYSEEGTIEGAICVPVTTEEIRLGDRNNRAAFGRSGRERRLYSADLSAENAGSRQRPGRYLLF